MITFNQGDGTTEAVHVISASYAVTASYADNAGGSGGISDIYNNNIRYIIDQGGSDYTLELTSTGDEWGGRTWVRSGTSVTITSAAHGLTNGNVVMVRNVNEDYKLSAVSGVTTNAFNVTVANSGTNSGTACAYVPAFSASVTNASGDVTAISITGNTHISSSSQLQTARLFANNMQSSPMSITLPAGTQQGAGTFGSKPNINPVIMSGLGVTGTGNSSVFTPTQQYSLGANFNVLKVGAVDTFTPIILKINF